MGNGASTGELSQASSEQVAAVASGLPSSHRDKVQEALRMMAPGLRHEDGEMSSYFARGYGDGECFQGQRYTEDVVSAIPTYRCDTADGPVHVWRHAFDLRGLGDGVCKDPLTLYHYTNGLCFRNVGNMTQSSSQLFASLLDERAHFGKGLYASQHEPAVWNSRTRILLNNYSNGDPLRDPLDAEGAQRVREWGDENRHGHRAAYCIPLIVPRDMAYNIFQRQTPDIAAKVVEDRNGETRHVRLGEDYKGRPVHSNRDVWIIRIAEAGAVGHAHASTDDVINLLERRLAKLRMSAGSLDSKTFDCLSELGHRYQSRARFDEAERLLREAFEGRLEKLGESDRGTLNSMAGLASVLQERGQLDEAEPLVRKALKISQATLDSTDPATLDKLDAVATLLQAQGRFTESEEFFSQALQGKKQVHGSNHPDTIIAVGHLGLAVQEQGRLSEAEKLFREALAISRETLGELHPHTLTSLSNLASVLLKLRQFSEAEDLFKEELEKCRSKLGNMHPDTLISVSNLGELYMEQGRLKEAEPLIREDLEGSRTMLGPTHPGTLISMNNLASLLQKQGKHSEALPLFRDALEGSRQALGDSHPDTIVSLINLGSFLEEQGQRRDAKELFQEALATSQREKLPDLARAARDYLRGL